MNSEKKVVNISYSDSCMKSYPCQHHDVELIYDNGSKYNVGHLNGEDIAQLYVKHNLSIPEHFQTYLKT
ncbi:unnamed protein product [Didymodactylos carnosus]|nr:unnamed protein product [Didymodactylos carnosus]CAF4277597.1 unnamed protein product [Didymodactylos carnosus]